MRLSKGHDSSEAGNLLTAVMPSYLDEQFCGAADDSA